jgi:hypothetical protein
MQAIQGNSTGKAPLSAADLNLTKTAYTLDEVLQRFPFGRSTLLGLIDAGELPVTRFGRRISFTTPDLVALVNKQRFANNPHLAA